jgi:hypothetical protein
MPPHLLQMSKQNQLSASPNQSNNNYVSSTATSLGPTAWTVDEVARWVMLKGFNEYKEVFERHMVNGLILLSANAEFLENVLEITNHAMVTSILKEIGLLKQSSICGDLSIMLRRSSLQTKLRSTPKLANTQSFEVMDRDVFHLHSDVVVMLLKDLEIRKAWEVEGIFRISGKRENIIKIHSSLKNAAPNFSSFDIHDVSCALKQYLREINDPMIPMSNYREIMNSVSSTFSSYTLLFHVHHHTSEIT